MKVVDYRHRRHQTKHDQHSVSLLFHTMRMEKVDVPGLHLYPLHDLHRSSLPECRILIVVSGGILASLKRRVMVLVVEQLHRPSLRISRSRDRDPT